VSSVVEGSLLSAWIGPRVIDELVLLAIAFVLSAAIGIERQRRGKRAGLRTHTLVGVGAAVFTLVSAHGFAGILGSDVVLDPSRIAAQVVSGIGFLGAGVIFVTRGGVSGLTTAASIWITAAVGMASGAGMPVLAAAATVLQLCTTWLLGKVGRVVSPKRRGRTVVIDYDEGEGALRAVLETMSKSGCEVTYVESERRSGDRRAVQARLRVVTGERAFETLLADVTGVPGVRTARLMMNEVSAQ
jgi:putative Mg2+ transporter-C (MgtC) family protein